MDVLQTLAVPALAAAAVLLLGALGLRAVRRRRKPSRPPRREVLDTVAGWPPERARVMTRRFGRFIAGRRKARAVELRRARLIVIW